MTPATFKRIRKERLQMTQRQMADALRIAEIRTIGRYEDGTRKISGPVSLLMELFDEGKI